MGELSPQRSELFADLLEVDGGQVVAERFEEWEVRQRQVGLGAAAGEDGHPDLAGAALDRAGEAALPHAGLPGEQDDLPIAAVGGEKGILELGELGLPTYQYGADNPIHRAREM